jgi:hypothetical protein
MYFWFYGSSLSHFQFRFTSLGVPLKTVDRSLNDFVVDMLNLAPVYNTADILNISTNSKAVTELHAVEISMQ